MTWRCMSLSLARPPPAPGPCPLLYVLPACQVVALGLVVMPHPRASNLQVVLPVNNDFYWLKALGYDGPRL